MVPEITHEVLIPLMWTSRTLKYNFLVLHNDNGLRKMSLISDDSSQQESRRQFSVILWHSDTKSGGIFMENAATFTTKIFFLIYHLF